MLRLLLTLGLFLIATPVFAAELYGLAMVGKPKYDKDSTHLSYANPDAPKGGTLKQAATGSFDTLNPFSIKGRAAQGLNLVTDRLMARVWDEPFTMYPLIAEKVDVPEDRSSITFHLHPKAQFHDGSAITADDVLFSFETLKNEGRPNMRRIYKLATPKKLGERSIRFSFDKGHDRETVMIFALMPVISKTYWEGKTFDATTLEAPLGSGPYKITEAEAGKRIVYERVKDYWAKDLLPNKGHNNFDKIIFEYFRDDTVAFESFKKGELDIRREWDAGKWNSNYDFPALKEGKVVKEEIKHGRPDKVRAFIFNTRRPPFNDIKVRQALGLMLDFDWLNKNLFYGQYEQINSYFPNTDLARTSESKEQQDRRTSMRQASEMLKETGWIVKDGKRVSEKTGEPMSFEILLDNPADEKIALSYTRNLKKMGIDVFVRVLDSAAFRGRITDYNYDMILYFWHSTLSPGTEQYLYWSCEAAEQSSRWNFAGVCDPEIDELAKTIPMATSRADLVKKTQALDSKLWDGHYMVPLYYNPRDFVAYWKHLERPENTALYGMVIETWWHQGDEAP